MVDSIAARRILDGVLRVLPSCNTEGHAVEVIDAWVEARTSSASPAERRGSVAFWAIGGQPGRLLTRPRMRSQWTSPTRWGSR